MTFHRASRTPQYRRCYGRRQASKQGRFDAEPMWTQRRQAP
jgi:hypothetical protein